MRPSLVRKFRPSPALAVAIAALVVAVSGVAYATIPGSNGVISGCYSKFSGALRVIDASKQTCPSYQVPISWSQTGPQGPPGEQGPVGPGANAYVATAHGTNGPLTQFATPLTAVTVPPGSYLISGEGLLGDSDVGTIARIDCELTDSAGMLQDDDSGTAQDTDGDNQEQTIALQTSLSVSTTDTITLACQNPSVTTVPDTSVTNASIQMVSVGTINGQ